MKFRSVPKPHGTHPGARRPVHPGSDAVAVMVGLSGWLALVAVVAWGVASQVGHRRAAAAVRARLAPAVAEIQAAIEPRSRGLAEEREALTTQTNEQVKHQEDVLMRSRAAELAVSELEPQAKTLERTQGKLSEAVGAMQADQGLAGEGLAALQAKVASLERTRDRLIEEYKARFQALRVAFEAAKDSPDADLLRRFYAEHRDSAFAPAAGYHAAEKLYAGKHSSDALRLYKEVLRVYPGSAYGEACTSRIAQIAAGGKYSEPAAEVAFEPYLPEITAPATAPRPDAPDAPAADAP